MEPESMVPEKEGSGYLQKTVQTQSSGKLKNINFK